MALALEQAKLFHCFKSYKNMVYLCLVQLRYSRTYVTNPSKEASVSCFRDPPRQFLSSSRTKYLELMVDSLYFLYCWKKKAFNNTKIIKKNCQAVWTQPPKTFCVNFEINFHEKPEMHTSFPHSTFITSPHSISFSL